MVYYDRYGNPTGDAGPVGPNGPRPRPRPGPPNPWDDIPYDPPDQPNTEGGCGPGTVPESIGSDGNWRTPAPGECITQDEFNRRVDLNVKNNPGKREGGGAVPAPASTGKGAPGTVPFPAQERYVPSPQDIELDGTIMQGVRDALSGKLNPWGSAEIARAKAAGLQATQGQAAQARGAVNRDMIRRGLSRSGLAVEQGAAIDRAASADYSKNLRETLRTAATENYQAKIAALERAQSYLNQRQQVALAGIRNTLDYQIASAQNSLANARLKQEMDALKLQLENSLRIAEMGNETQLAALLAQYGGRGV